MSKFDAANIEAAHTQRHLDAIPQSEPARSTVKPIVMGKPKCVQCDATVREMERHGITFEYVDLTEDAAAMELATSLGHRSAPVVVWGVHNWSGFMPDKIRAIADASK